VVIGYDPSSNSIITSFRGTDNVKNVVEDIDFKFNEYKQPGCGECQVHGGFFDSYLSVKNLLLPAVKELVPKYPKASIIVTGHSLGAAQAMFGAVDYQ
jgi:putative lipase involved disintegration of autophagic bodies